MILDNLNFQEVHFHQLDLLGQFHQLVHLIQENLFHQIVRMAL